METMRKFLMRALIVLFIPILFVLSHISPSISLRTHLFFSAHPIGAVTTKIEFNEFQQNLDKAALESEKAKIYCISGSIKDPETGNYLFNFKVTRYGFLYIAEEYGEC